MTINFKFIAVTLSMVCGRAASSIAGVTYMDDFDFEQRYRNVHECDPFYWHPLHLPEECADMYEKLIRSRLPTRLPKHTHIPEISPTQLSFEPYHYHYQYSENSFYPTAMKLGMEPDVEHELTPYEEMLESVQKDVNNLPSVPTLKNMPNFGPVAVYQQPVSQISADMIKKIAMIYANPSDDRKGKDRNHHTKGGSKWKQLVDKVRRREQTGWKKINSGDIVSFSKF